MRHAAFFLFVSLVASSSQATVSTTPANPVAGVPFVVHVFAFCANIGDATVTGTNINIPVPLLGLCCAFCYTQRDVTVGPLPVGTYTIRLVAGDNSIVETLPVVVVADVPALDPRLLAILAVALIVIAILQTK